MPSIGLNTLDLLLLVILFIGLLIGLFRGTLPQVISIVSIWLGLVASLWLYKIFSFRILQGLDMGATISDTMAFIILLIIFFHAIRLVVRYVTVPPEEKKRKRKSQDDPLADAAKTATERFIIGPLNMLGGMIMGLVLTILWLTLILGVVQFFIQPTELSPTVTGLSGRLAGQINGSSLVPMFNSMLSLIVFSVDFFVPADADIFRKVVSLIQQQ